VAIPLPHLDTAVAGRTHCPFCAYQCGMLLGEAEDGWRISGDPHFPVNRGRLCIKGWTATDLLHHPQRLRQPLLHGHPVDWDTAYDHITERIHHLQRHYGPEAIGVFGSGALTNEKAYYLGKFARLVLRTPHIDYNGRYCMSSAAAACNKAFGIDRGLPFPVSDIARARTILLVGSNPWETLPPMAQWFEQQRACGGRLIVVDPRRTATARAADLHLAITPGSDLALANGLLFLAIEEKLINLEFIRTRTVGYEAVHRTVLHYHPERVEQLTGLAESALRQAIRWLAEEPSLILTGRGAEQHSKGVDTVLGYINLALALGHVGKPGGWLRLPDRTSQRPGRTGAWTESGSIARLPPDRSCRPSRAGGPPLGCRSADTTGKRAERLGTPRLAWSERYSGLAGHGVQFASGLSGCPTHPTTSGQSRSAGRLRCLPPGDGATGPRRPAGHSMGGRGWDGH
jgi:assimilatory nitrate reductase catalytic subunit